MAWKRPIVLCIAAFAAVLGGCGGDDPLTKAEYEQKVRSVYAEIQAAFRATDVPPAQLAERVEKAQAALRDGADELDEAKPPQEVEVENEALAEGMRRYADDLERLRKAAERGDALTIADFNARVARNRWVEQMAEAAEAMRGKGYDLGQIAEE